MKIYLAKSNRCNPIDYINIRNLLLQHKIDILEYTGGDYTDTKLLSSDMLIVLPEIYSTAIKLGKGLYSQIKTFCRHNENAWIVSNSVNFDVIKIDTSRLTIYNSTDYVNYGTYDSNCHKHVDLSNMLPLKYEIIL
jgi:hypothetical protein